MQIFDKEIFGSDADYFMALPKQEKVQWIKDNTNQHDDVLIHDFVCTCNKGSDERCNDCKKNKSNVTNGIPTQDAAATEQTDARGTGLQPDNKGRKQPKGGKA